MAEPAALEQLSSDLLSLLPRLGGATLALVVGTAGSIAAGRFVGWACRRLRIDAALEGLGASRVLHALGLRSGVDRVAGGTVAWVGVLLTLAAVAELLGLTTVTRGFASVVAYLPQVFAAVGMLVAGLVAADTLRTITARLAAGREDLAAPKLAGDLVYYAVLAVTLTLSAEQLGLDIGLVHHLILLLMGALLLGFGLSFALGGQHAFRDLVARHQAERLFRPGDHVRAGALEGVLLRFEGGSAVLRGPDGETTAPARLLVEAPVQVSRVDDDA
jgi:hypothetical protein